MSGDGIEYNWYDILGIPATASHEEVKQAYYRLVRRFSPRQYPSDFQRITRAYYTLGDKTRKAEYDQARANGRRVTVLVDQAALAAEKDPQKAMVLLKSAVTLAPDMPRPRALLAHVLMRIGEFEVAERQYRWLVRYAPQDEMIRLRLSRCIFRQGRLADAEAELRETLKLNPGYHDALTLLSEIYEAGHLQHAQEEALERAVLNDGKVNWADFDALTRLFLLQLERHDGEAVQQASERLRSVISTERAPEAVQKLSALAEDHRKEGKLGLATNLLKHAALIPLGEENAELAEALPQQQARLERIAEAKTLICDTLLGSGLKALIQTFYLEEGKDAIRQSRMQAALDRIKQETEFDPRGFIQQLEYIRKEYSKIGTDQEGTFAVLRRRADARLEQLALEAAAAPKPPVEPPTPEPAARRGFFDRILGNSSG